MPIIGIPSSGGEQPTTPTIGTATDDGTGTGANVAFTPSTYIGKGTISYTATSSPGSFTGTGSASPINVTGLTIGTAYTFTVKGNTNYGVASASSAASNSVTPVSPTSFESIATFNPTGAIAVTFSSIPQTYKHLQLRAIYREMASTTNANYLLNFNGDSTAANYAWHRLYGDGTTVTATGLTNNGSIIIYAAGTGASSTANVFGASIVDILDYTSTAKYKTVRYLSGIEADTASTAYKVNLGSGFWASTSALTQISIALPATGWAPGTQFALYGIKG